MLGFLKRKFGAAAPAPAPVVAEEPAAEAGHEWNPFDCGETTMRLLGTFMREGSFIGGLNDTEGFVVQAMPDGMEIAMNDTTMTGVVIAENAAGIAMAGVAPMQVAMVSLDTTFGHYLKHRPDWQITETDLGSDFACQIPLIAPYILSVECTGGEVDALFNGQFEKGTTMTLQVKKVS